MKDFETFKLKFHSRVDFERAHKFVFDRHPKGFDAGHSDMVLAFFSEDNRAEMAEVLNLLGLRFEAVDLK